MRTQTKKKQVYRSMVEFEHKFLSEFSQPKTVESAEEARLLGVNMARESLNKIKIRLAK